jgi:N-acetylmuramoyl-L-alanine amidase
VRVVRVVVTPEATPEPTPIETPEPTPTPRLTLTAGETDLIARIVWHEARGESAEGQRAVVEVIFNRIEADNFPDTVEDVIYQKNQFSSAEYIDSAEPSDEQFVAINEALYEEPMLPSDVVYFSQGAENDRVWGVIGGHTFCYQYVW